MKICFAVVVHDAGVPAAVDPYRRKAKDIKRNDPKGGKENSTRNMEGPGPGKTYREQRKRVKKNRVTLSRKIREIPPKTRKFSRIRQKNLLPIIYIM